MKGRPVYFNTQQRGIAGQAMVEKLLAINVEVIAASVDSTHYHLLGRFVDAQVRPKVGRAKKNASHILSQHGLPGTVWARKCHALPIADRGHQVNVFHYILDHAEQDAWTWTFREGLYWLTQDQDRT